MNKSSPKKAECMCTLSTEEKDATNLYLAKRMIELKNECDKWTEIGTQKVMQAARKLSKDQAELESLRREKQIKLENKIKFLELETAVYEAHWEADQALDRLDILENEFNRLQIELEVAKEEADDSEACLAEALEIERKTKMLFESSRREKSLLQKELASEKQKYEKLKEQKEQAISQINKFESKMKLEKNAKEKLLIQGALVRKEREEFEASAKAKLEMAILKAERRMQKYKDDIHKIETQISQFKLKIKASENYASEKGINISSKMPMKGNKNKVKGGLKREKECVMCLSEETYVVFTPCGHQAVCKKCNEIHEKQGMKDCPSCRTPIQQRICVRYARP